MTDLQVDRGGGGGGNLSGPAKSVHLDSGREVMILTVFFTSVFYSWNCWREADKEIAS